LPVANVPGYSPHSVAEHAVAMLLALNRKIPQSRLRMALQDYRLNNLVGFDIFGKTVGVVGTGSIGLAFARIMIGFGANVIAIDPVPSAEAQRLGIKYVTLHDLLRQSDIISLHCPLNDSTRRLFTSREFQAMKPGAILINTARGAVVDTEDLMTALAEKRIGGACLDVYEKEKGLYFEDHSADVLTDQLYARLRSYPNIFMTSHQGFLTHEALAGIAQTTIVNLDCWDEGKPSPNEL
jgi:D-lactate dehydrogenase